MSLAKLSHVGLTSLTRDLPGIAVERADLCVCVDDWLARRTSPAPGPVPRTQTR